MSDTQRSTAPGTNDHFSAASSDSVQCLPEDTRLYTATQSFSVATVIYSVFYYSTDVINKQTSAAAAAAVAAAAASSLVAAAFAAVASCDGS